METVKRLLLCIFYDPHRLKWWLTTWKDRRRYCELSPVYRRTRKEILRSYIWGEDNLWLRIAGAVFSLCASTYLFVEFVRLLIIGKLVGMFGILGVIFRVLVILFFWSAAHLNLQTLETAVSHANEAAYYAEKEWQEEAKKRAAYATANEPPAATPVSGSDTSDGGIDGSDTDDADASNANLVTDSAPVHTATFGRRRHG